ncbi:MAG TPA: hypothetical protein VGY13_01810 [Solirubrobacteraceae bacterium]|jgi:hypothetical protein|nr:hypothetical protein [Solirubrobacteraceae bacterium]
MIARRSISHVRIALALMAGALVLALGTGVSSAAAEGVAHWHILTRTAPTKFAKVGEEGLVVGILANLGDAPLETKGHPDTITDELPADLEAVGSAEAFVDFGEVITEDQPQKPKLPCSGLVCTYEGALPPYIAIELKIHVKVKAGLGEPLPASLGENVIHVEGGGAGDETGRSLPIQSGSSVPFGVERYELQPETAGGQPETQAGSHPFQLTTTLAFNQTYSENPLEKGLKPSTPQLLRNVNTVLPPGLIGNTNYGEECSDEAFNQISSGNFNACPGRSAAGVAIVTFRNPGGISLEYGTETLPVFDLTPAKGEPARLGFEFEGVPVVLDTSVLTGKSYAVEVSSKNTSASAEVMSVILSIWGTPAAETHNEARGWECLGHGYKLVASLGTGAPPCEPSNEKAPAPYLTLPTTCEKPLESTVGVTSWKPGETPPPTVSTHEPVQLEGCAGLPFTPAFEMEPTEHTASTPTGFDITVRIPQGPTLRPTESEGAVAENNAQETQVVFPSGVLSNAGFSNGLGTCTAEQVGFEGVEDEAGFGEQLENDKFSAAVFGCPEVSKIGTVKIVSPYVKRAEPFLGALYLAKQHTDPFKPELITYLSAENPESGIRVKLAGEVKVLSKGQPLPGGGESTEGQLVSTFRGTPPVPFETLEINLPAGGRASNTTPAFCGPATSSANFTTFSGEAAHPPSVVSADSTFNVSSGPNGSPCPGATLPFSPGFQAGSVNPQAGAFTPFTLKIQRPDGSQALKAITMETPPGLAAVLASVPLCEEPQAAAGTCGEESLIGKSLTKSGLGGTPVALPGSVYLTGPYGGAPFGLSSVTEVNTGPFHVGRVVIRSAINVNPTTAQAIITTNEGQFFPLLGEAAGAPQFGAPEATHGLPEFVDHVPAQLKELEVEIDRPNFEFNPTSCNELKTTGTLVGGESSGEQVSDPVSSPFFVSNCAALPFQPKLAATVASQGSKFKGVTFKVTVESPGLGQANIHKVDLTLPAVLPSRQSTIEKACLAATFEANPASCDEGSVIGEGIVNTPVFKNPLRGPAYLVSHGAAEFPDVEFVLQGEGVKVLLDGKTDIKNGITYSKFETSPDAPFTKFESIFPEGPHSALTTFVPEAENYNLCKHASQLVLPTTMVAQNGAVIERTANIALEGCGAVKSSKVKKLSRAQLLAKALKACKKDRKKSKRVACEKAAHKKYGSHAKKSSHKGKKAAKKK